MQHPLLLQRVVRPPSVPLPTCREYSSNYVAAEDGARAAKRGIWAGAFDIPADWRKERKVR